MKPRPIDPLRGWSLIHKALDDGAQPSGGNVLRWDTAGACESPFEMVLVTQLDPKHEGVWVRRSAVRQDWTIPFGDEESSLRYFFEEKWQDFHRQPCQRVQITEPFYLEILRPCRRCPTCLLARQKQWQARACSEFDNAKRTWFVTLTLRPEARFYALIDGGYKKFLDREWTLMLKRLRKNIALPFRYLSVLEEHMDGVLHLHALLHDVEGLIPKAAIRCEWSHGITECKLAGKDKAFYISKYLLKSTRGRVRASLRYGDPYGDNEVCRGCPSATNEGLDPKVQTK